MMCVFAGTVSLEAVPFLFCLKIEVVLFMRRKWSLAFFLLIVSLICFVFVGCNNVDESAIEDAAVLATLKTELNNAFLDFPCVDEVSINNENKIIDLVVLNDIEEIDFSQLEPSLGAVKLTSFEGEEIDLLYLDEEEKRVFLSATSNGITVTYVLKIKKGSEGHVHDYPGWWSIVDAATCTVDGLKKRSCTICGAEQIEAIPASGHKYGKWETVTESTSEHDGLKKKVCSACGDEVTEIIPKHVHNLVHHSAKEPTCTSVGWSAYDTCSLCDYTTYTELPKVAHMEVTDAAVAATCTRTGLTEGKHCSVCGQVTVAQVVTQLLPHTEVIDPAVAASCTKTGLTEGKHCLVCNRVIVARAVVQAKGHSYGEFVTTSSVTCTTDGQKQKTCSACGDVVTQTITKLGHNLVHHSAKEATYEIVGWYAYDTCSRCDYSTYQEIPLLSYGITYHCDSSIDLLNLPVAYTIKDDDIFLPNFTKEGYRFSWKISYGYDKAFSEGLSYEFDSSSNSYTVTGRGSCASEIIVIPKVYNNYPVSKIKAKAFSNQSGIQTIIIQDNIKSIGDQAFFRCSSLTTAIIVSSEVISVGSDLFGYVWGNNGDGVRGFMLYVPENQLNGYKGITAEYWQKYLVQTNQIAAWSDDMVLREEYSSVISTSAKKDVDVYAVFTPIDYAITYHLDGGENAEGNLTSYTVESPTINLFDPSKASYEFLGWYTDDEFHNRIYTIVARSHGDMGLYAKWQPIVYSIRYVADEYVTLEGLPEGYTVESETIELPTFERDYYAFSWEIDSIKVTCINTSVGKDLTLKAIWTPVEYAISYELNGGTNDVNNPTSYTIESATICLLTPAKTAYEFLGWYVDGANPIDTISTGSWGDLYLCAKWQPVAFNITYLADEYVSLLNLPITYTVEDENIILPTFERDYYEFVWKINSEIVACIDTSLAKDLTVNAIWIPESFSITYELNGGANNSNNPVLYNVESEITLSKPKKPGYNFNGWIGSNGDTPELDVIILTGSHGDLSYTATWSLATYDIEYVLYNGENHIKNPCKYTIEDIIELKPATKTGYTFEGWYLEDSFINQITNVMSSAGNLVLYAEFVAKSYKATFVDDEKSFFGDFTILTITFECNNGNVAIVEYLHMGESMDPYSIKPTKTGYLFEGWYSDFELTEKIVGDILITGDTILYAKWIEKNNLYPVSAGGYYVENDDSVTFVAPTNSKKLYLSWALYGYIMWGPGYSNLSTTGTCTVNGVIAYSEHFEATRTTSSSGSRTQGTSNYLYVNCKAGDVITVSVRGYSGHMTASVVEFDYSTIHASETIRTATYYYDEPLLDNIPTVNKNGYEFLGWTNSDSTLLTSLWRFEADQTFSPQWIPIEYTIEYELDGGKNDENNPSKYTIESDIILLPPEKKGYTFIGWYSDEKYTHFVDRIKNQTGELTLFALFVVNEYELYLDGQGGVFAPKVAFYSDSIIKEEYLVEGFYINAFYPPEREGYIFAGWYIDSELETIFSFGGTLTDNLTLYARWIETSYESIQIESREMPIHVNIIGQTEQYFVFVPMANGEITITSNSGLDIYGVLYDEHFIPLLESDDISDTNLNFSISYMVNAGECYYLSVRGATSITNGVADISIERQGDCFIAGSSYENRIKNISYGGDMVLPDNVMKEGFVFVGWFDDDNQKYESGTWNYTRNLLLRAVFELKE